MNDDAQYLVSAVSEEAGFSFEAETGMNADGHYWYLLRPLGLLAVQTFAIRITVGWRRLIIAFEPGKFAGELLAEMSSTDETGRSTFLSVLGDCENNGAEISLQVNGNPYQFDNSDIWSEKWSRFELLLNKGQLDLGVEDGEEDIEIVRHWTSSFAAAIISILPLDQEESDQSGSEVIGFPEGATTIVKVNRYERDRRNRAAAISIHGTSCAACGLDMGKRYGKSAIGFIEIHHTTPVSQLTPGYVIDPEKDLIPMCPNCHAIAHRRSPPFSIEEIRSMLQVSD